MSHAKLIEDDPIVISLRRERTEVTAETYAAKAAEFAAADEPKRPAARAMSRFEEDSIDALASVLAGDNPTYQQLALAQEEAARQLAQRRRVGHRARFSVTRH
jgi:hypothetical protein